MSTPTEADADETIDVFDELACERNELWVENKRLRAALRMERADAHEIERLRVIVDEYRHWHICTHTNPCWSGEPKQA